MIDSSNYLYTIAISNNNKSQTFGTNRAISPMYVYNHNFVIVSLARRDCSSGHYMQERKKRERETERE